MKLRSYLTVTLVALSILGSLESGNSKPKYLKVNELKTFIRENGAISNLLKTKNEESVPGEAEILPALEFPFTVITVDPEDIALATFTRDKGVLKGQYITHEGHQYIGRVNEEELIFSGESYDLDNVKYLILNPDHPIKPADNFYHIKFHNGDHIPVLIENQTVRLYDGWNHSTIDLTAVNEFISDGGAYGTLFENDEMIDFSPGYIEDEYLTVLEPHTREPLVLPWESIGKVEKDHQQFFLHRALLQAQSEILPTIDEIALMPIYYESIDSSIEEETVVLGEMSPTVQSISEDILDLVIDGLSIQIVSEESDCDDGLEELVENSKNLLEDIEVTVSEEEMEEFEITTTQEIQMIAFDEEEISQVLSEELEVAVFEEEEIEEVSQALSEDVLEADSLIELEEKTLHTAVRSLASGVVEHVVDSLEVESSVPEAKREFSYVEFAQTYVPSQLKVVRQMYAPGKNYLPTSKRPTAISEEGGFWIDSVEVTNEQYATFIEATGRSAPSHWNGSQSSEDPVTNISYKDAVAFARWVGKRLPTLEEWKRAIPKVQDASVPYIYVEEVSYPSLLEKVLPTEIQSTLDDRHEFQEWGIIDNITIDNQTTPICPSDDHQPNVSTGIRLIRE